MYRLFDIYESELCQLIDCEANLSNLAPHPDPSNALPEAIRGDMWKLRSRLL